MKKPFFIALLISLGSCIKPETPPDYVIPTDTMARILVDVHMAEATVSVNASSLDTVKLNYPTFRKDIYKKYNITQDRFDSSMSFYSKNVKYLDKIYEVVIDSLSVKESKENVK